MHHFPFHRQVQLIGLLILPFLAATLTAEGPSRMSAYQYHIIYGWHSGDKRFVDTATEMTPEAYTAFWNLDIPNRQLAFNFFAWPVVEALLTMQMTEIMAPTDPKKQANQNRIQTQYENLANMLAIRFSVPIKLGNIKSGLLYFIELGQGNGNVDFLTITILFDNIDLLKPSGFQVGNPDDNKQQTIRISPNGNVFYQDIVETPSLSQQQLLMRDFLFR